MGVSAARHDPQPPRGRPILVVEDDDDIRESLCAVLEDAGYAVATARNGREALAEVTATMPALVVLDLMMPVMDGWEFRAVQLKDPAIAEVPVVVLTADSSPKAAAISADSFISKPVSAAHLLLVLERVLLDRDRRALAARSEETERLTLLGTIAAGVGHEINNPLTYTIANLEQIDGALPEIVVALQALSWGDRLQCRMNDVQKALAEARGGAERVRLIVRNLQALSRRGDDTRAMTDLTAVMESIIAMAWNLIRDRARLVRVFEDTPQVWGNEVRLGQVFLNLLVNASQALPDGDPETNEIRVRIAGAPGGGSLVEVSDTGRGMSEALRRRIFEPFFTTKGQAGGTGLGLSICHDIVREHGGHIEVESALGRGSTFRVFLPAASEGPDPRDKKEDTGAPPHPAIRQRVWVLDDEPFVRALVTRVVSAHHDGRAIETPGELFRLLERGERFDVLFCDVMMPEMSGIDVARRIQRDYPHVGGRIIFITGGVHGQEASTFLNAPGRRVLEKPFKATDLLAAIAGTSAVH